MRKSRVAHAKVEAIVSLDGKSHDTAVGIYETGFVYRLGERALPDSYDPNPYHCCGHGIHVHKYKVDCLVHSHMDMLLH